MSVLGVNELALPSWPPGHCASKTALACTLSPHTSPAFLLPVARWVVARSRIPEALGDRNVPGSAIQVAMQAGSWRVQGEANGGS